MRLKKGWNGHWFLVFETEDDLTKWLWLFSRILHRPVACFGGYCNAFFLF